jgi:hypothetical protein
VSRAMLGPTGRSKRQMPDCPPAPQWPSPGTRWSEIRRVIQMDAHMQAGSCLVWYLLSGRSLRPRARPCCPPPPKRSRDKPTFEVKEEREPVGHHCPLAAHHAVAQEGLRISAQGLRSLGATHTHPDASVRSSERGRVDAYQKQQSGPALGMEASGLSLMGWG